MPPDPSEQFRPVQYPPCYPRLSERVQEMKPLRRRSRRSLPEIDGHSPRHSVIEHQSRHSGPFELSSGMAEEAAAVFNPSSTFPVTQSTIGARNTQPEVIKIRQRRQRLPQEHSRRAFTNPGIPAIGEESEDDLSMGIPQSENPRSGNKKRKATEVSEEPDVPAASTVNDGARTPSVKRQRTSGSTSSPRHSFSGSLASMSPSSKKMEALEYKATSERREAKRRAVVRRVGDKFVGDGHLSRWLDDLQTSALRRTSQSLRRDIHNNTIGLRKMKMDDRVHTHD
ncbi:MAG: hypothetical protein Q9216_006548 [Gyalolechia sp. 2 TL-2023]